MSRRSYEGRAVLVTGAGGGLGAALCERFARGGAQVGGLDRDPEGLERTAERLRGQGRELSTAVCDITDEGAARQAIHKLEAELGPTFVLANNAGITHIRPFGEDQAPDLRRVVEVNLFGAVYCTAAALPGLRQTRGQMVAISSVAGYAPLPGRAGYAASKHGLQGFCNTLRAELRGSGVSILVVCPSFVDTGIRDDQGGDQAGGGGKRTIGRALSPERAADQIYRAAQRNRRQISIGTVGRLAHALWRLSPRLYELAMRGTVSGED